MKFFARFTKFAALLTLGGLFWTPDASVRLPEPVSFSGLSEMLEGSYEAAFLAVKRDTLNRGSLHQLFKLGTIAARLNKTDDAQEFLNKAGKSGHALAPLAFEQIGDLHKTGGENVLAIAAYASALRVSGLPVKYRRSLFAKIKSIEAKGVDIPSGQSWSDEYRRWAENQSTFDAAAFGAQYDSLFGAGHVAEADSLLEQNFSQLDSREACGFIGRFFKGRSDDSTLSAQFLFALALQSGKCRDFETAQKLLSSAQKRKNFSHAVTAKRSALLSAQIAFGKAQWQQAISLYKKYNSHYGHDSEVLMQIARAYRNLNNFEEADKWYNEHIRHFPSNARTQEILWLRAWRNEEKNHFKSAASVYRNVLNTKGKRTEEAHLRYALCFYRQQQYDSAIVVLTNFQKKYPQSNYLWAGMFWQGKCLLARGKAEEAHRIWNNLSKLDPTDYYAHRARQLMGDSISGLAVTNALLSAGVMPEERVLAWLDSVSPSSKKKLTDKDSVDLRRGAALLAVGLPLQASFFLENAESNYHGNLALQYDLAKAYTAAGSAALAFRVSRRLAWRIPVEHRAAVPVQVKAQIFPSFYSSVISENASRFGVDPLLVSAVIRQESIFDMNIVSPAGAAGLMQIMPYTGKDIALKLNEKFAQDSLYNYAYNIRFGTFYLRKLLDQFKGDHVLTLCSYNAGPHNAVKWHERNKNSEYDLFIEDIGFLETRGYVRKVMANYWTYKALVHVPGYVYEMPEEAFPWVNEW
ncbi:MAG: transglycosylase SLT domain-containing protein [Chitinispirillales bacterium]|jgi:soluble lytic murein transglycosylase-like protein/TolA-binding protein|nr:transglycosylase SLT domain-containing protein [Chitinispirillales bacterium]